jgi:hypothetical protein
MQSSLDMNQGWGGTTFLFDHPLQALIVATVVVIGAGIAIATAVRAAGGLWTWASLGFPAGLVFLVAAPSLVVLVWLAGIVASALGSHWHSDDLARGGTLAETAHARVRVRAAVHAAFARLTAPATSTGPTPATSTGPLGRDMPPGTSAGESSLTPDSPRALTSDSSRAGTVNI